MGLISYILSFFDFNSTKRDIEPVFHPPCDEHFASAPSAKRFKLNEQNPTLSDSILGTGSGYLNIGNMSPKQYFTSRRKVPTSRRQVPVVQINESDDDDDCQITKNPAPTLSKKKEVREEDEIQVVPSGQDSVDNDVSIVHEEVSIPTSPCSSQSQKLLKNNKPKPEVYVIEDNEDRVSNNKENNAHHDNASNLSDDDEIEVVDTQPRSMMKKSAPNGIFPRWSTADRSKSPLLSRNSGSSFLFKRKHPHERQNTLQQIQKLQSREAYAKLLQAITHLTCTQSQASPLPSSSRNSSSPSSSSELDMLERLSSQCGAPQISHSRIPVARTAPSSLNKEDKLDAMIRKLQSIDLHRFDSQIARRALAVEKANEKVRSLEIPSYNVLLEKTINLRKVPERLQVKKVEPQLPEISEELETLIKRMKCSGRMDTVVSKIGLEEITKDQILSLEGLTWLKDNVINCYMALIMERSKEKTDLPRAYGFNTFFHSALAEHGYSRVKRWTKKVDLFSYDILLVPIHVQKIHWCLATIDFRKKCLTYYDSMAGPDRGCLNRLLTYLGEESMDKKKTPFDTSSWSVQCPKDVPQQQNSSDCGVFTSTFAEYLSRNADIFKIKQKDMPYYRKKMMAEILSKKLLT
ncbi:hypothetical protein M8J75_006579 [Diaphorina citri]|nr:hypothetical protein M8J75_006579 [Diaphorina citri]